MNVQPESYGTTTAPAPREATHGPAPAASPSPAGDLDRPAILVVEDEPDTVSLLRDILEREGFRVLSAGSVPDALALLAVEKVRLILLDLMLPGMNGFDFCRTIAGTGVSGSAPIMVVTGLDSFLTHQSFLEELFGVELFLYKPFSRARLLDGVRRLLALPRGSGARFTTTPPPSDALLPKARS
ncbi:MAG: response regulator [Planctomycetes bacterium]|nr:response regulator [Planctomycetota bacterium]